jgi:hypothetical protein
VAISGSNTERNARSPTAPRRMPRAVIPICTVPITRTGSPCSRSATAAPLLPASARRSSAVRRAVTSAYSASTKNALATTSRAMTTMSTANPMGSG